MEMDTIRQKLSEFSVTELTGESINEFETNIDQYLCCLQQELSEELEKKRVLANNIGIAQGKVSELWDRVDKARRRETDLSHRVTAWAQHFSDQMKVLKEKKEQIGLTIDSSASLSVEIRGNLEKLAEKRENVYRMREEIDHRRRLHKQQMKSIKEDMKQQEKNIEHWNEIASEISRAVKRLKEKKETLVEKLEEEIKQETMQKKMLEQLEANLRNVSIQNSKKMEKQNDCSRFISSFSALTEESN